MSKPLAKAPEVLPPRIPVANIVHQINRDWDEGHRLHQRLEDRRLMIGFQLLGLRKRIEAGEEGDQSWWPWFKANFPGRNADHAQKLMDDAAAADPRLAVELRRAGDAARSKTYRGRKRAELEDLRHQSSMNRVTSHGAEPEFLPPEPTEEPEPQSGPLPPPAQPARDYLWEAVGHKNQILELLKLMRPIEREQFLIVLVEEATTISNQFLDLAPADVVSRMDATMQERMREYGPLIAQWLWAAAQAAGFKPDRRS
jgi:hypothetical protein